MFWPLISTGGFGLTVAVVIVLGRGPTARWEQERSAAEEPEPSAARRDQ